MSAEQETYFSTSSTSSSTTIRRSDMIVIADASDYASDSANLEHVSDGTIKTVTVRLLIFVERWESRVWAHFELQKLFKMIYGGQITLRTYRKVLVTIFGNKKRIRTYSQSCAALRNKSLFLKFKIEY